MKQQHSSSYKGLVLPVLLIWLTLLAVVLYNNQPATVAFSAADQSGAAVHGVQTRMANPLGCQPNEIFLSSQAWWANATGNSRGEDGRLADDFGHLHTELCFPHKAVIRGEMTLRVNSMLHSNPGELRQLMIQIYNDSEIERPTKLCDSNHAYACLNFRPARTLANCERTGGTYANGGTTCSWWDTITFDTAEHPLDGWQQIRVRGFVREPDGEEMRTSTGLHVYLDNGNRPVVNVYEDPDVVEARGWYGQDVNYSNAKIEEMPTEPVSGVWRPNVEMDKGADGIPVTSYVVKIDADAHQGIPGITIAEGNGRFEGHLNINTRQLENGWHRLTLKANAFHAPSGSTNSGIAIILFEVENDPPCHNNCQPAIPPSGSLPMPMPSPTPSPTPSLTLPNDGIIRVNFQPEGTALVNDNLPDYGFTFGQRYGYSYGWNQDVSHKVRIRHTNSDPRLDTVAHLLEDARWEMTVPNGLYEVTVSVGDAVDGGRPHTINVEGVNYWLHELLGANEFRLKSAIVEVSDGRLTVDAVGQNDDETHLNYLEIKPTTTPPTNGKIKINFQPQGTQIIDEYLPDYGFAFASRYGYAYGWSQDVSSDTKIRHTHEDPRLDTVAHILQNTRWEIELPNGMYEVAISIGDVVDGNRLHTVNVEGVNYWMQEMLEANDFRLKSEVVKVTDGRLTIDQAGQNDNETHINYLEITPSNPILIEQPSPAVLFVSTTGSDETGDGSLDNPYQTLAKAVNGAEPPTIIYARAGTYDAQNLFSPIDEQSLPIMLRPFPGEEVIFLTEDN